LARW